MRSLGGWPDRLWGALWPRPVCGSGCHASLERRQRGELWSRVQGPSYVMQEAGAAALPCTVRSMQDSAPAAKTDAAKADADFACLMPCCFLGGREVATCPTPGPQIRHG